MQIILRLNPWENEKFWEKNEPHFYQKHQMSNETFYPKTAHNYLWEHLNWVIHSFCVT
jgi:hypothetical protein